MTPREERQNTIQKARVLYIKTGLETSLTDAYWRYLLEHPLEPRHPVTISKEDTDYAKPSIIRKENRPKCPDCGKAMSLGKVNTSKQNQVGGGYHTQWLCPDEKGCGFQNSYSTLTVEEQIKKYGND